MARRTNEKTKAPSLMKQYSRILKLCIDVLGNGITDNNQLNDLMNWVLPNSFKGVCASNEVDKLLKLMRLDFDCIIVNNRRASTGGEHWVALIHFKDKNWYYDTFDRAIGEFVDARDIPKWINLRDANEDVDQSVNEDNCGARCCAWLIMAIEKRLPPDVMAKYI